MPSKIRWTDDTWNPVAGCTKCSPGCANCYAERMAHRLPYMGNDNPQYFGKTDDEGHWTGEVECCWWLLDKPLHWRKPRRIFVCSMCDLFHEAVPFEFIDAICGTVCLSRQHIFQVLTKRPQRALEYFADESEDRGLLINREKMLEKMRRLKRKWKREIALELPLPNLWLGVSVCNQQEADEKIPILLQIPAAKRFVSLEPLLGPVDVKPWIAPWFCEGCTTPWFEDELEDDPQYEVGGFYQCPECRETNNEGMLITPEERYGKKLDWVIVGGESKGAYTGRECKLDWVRSIVQQCKVAGVPVHVKQLHVDGKLVKDITKFPKDLQVREYPR